MHLGIDLCLLIWIGEIFLQCMDHKLCEFWVSVQDMDALYYVMVIEFVGLASKCGLISDKFQESIWQFFINDSIEFVGTRE